jgi:hypothetical protein
VFNDQGDLLTLTDTKGKYTIFNLPAGVFTVKASSTNYLPESKVVILTSAETAVVNFALITKQRFLQS